ncbi:MAG: hypothetical protein SFU85_06960 [Candidatus Methylacidiphilales bacterium]|nr:hypothetical protein [Candidatus Methylacidiphilales bacterium]
MKFHTALLVSALLPIISFAETLIPSSLNPAFTESREKAFIPWSDPEQSTTYWKELSPKNVPIYYERKHGDLSRDIYIPNPGIGYWVLAGLTKENLFKTHREKLKINDTLVSASIYKDEKGNDIYWALWAPRQRAYLLTDKMKELGIGQAQIEYSIFDRFGFFAASLKPFSGIITWASLAVNLILLIVIVSVFILRSKQKQ